MNVDTLEKKTPPTTCTRTAQFTVPVWHQHRWRCGNVALALPPACRTDVHGAFFLLLLLLFTRTRGVHARTHSCFGDVGWLSQRCKSVADPYWPRAHSLIYFLLSWL